MNLRPLHDRVIVKRLDQETKTASGLIIPDAAAEKPDQGEILAQFETDLSADDTLDSLAEKIQQLEHKHFPIIVEQTILTH